MNNIIESCIFSKKPTNIYNIINEKVCMCVCYSFKMKFLTKVY